MSNILPIAQYLPNTVVNSPQQHPKSHKPTSSVSIKCDNYEDKLRRRIRQRIIQSAI